MRQYILALLLAVMIGKTCSNEDEILIADQEYDSSGEYQNDARSYKKLMTNISKDKSCYERKEKAIPLKYRDDLEADKRTLRIKLPAEYVIVRGSKEICSSEKECKERFQSMTKRASFKGCLIEDNFYVGGDGYVYEGRGWDVAPYWHLNGLRSKAVTVQFFGDYMVNYPKPQVMDAFRTVLKVAEWTGKISKTYKITSMRELFNDSSYLGWALDEHLMTWKNWANAKYMTSLWHHTIPEHLTFVFRDQWNASSESKNSSAQMTRPVAHIIISDGGQRCLNRSQCSVWMKDEQNKFIKYYGDLLDNFYIGEDGEVYEGRGWDKAPHWDLPRLTGDALSIRIIGSHEHRLPSKKAINSLKQLVQTGLSLLKLSQDYKLISLRHVYGDKTFMGKHLQGDIDEWISRWKPGKTKKANEDSHFPPFVKWTQGNTGWEINAGSWHNTEISKAVDYVIIRDGGDRCFNRFECNAVLDKEVRMWSLSGNLPDNFYVGEDGIVYEGKGWHRLSEWRSLFVGIAFVTVKFMGTFLENEPTWLGLTAFNTFLATGIESGRISPNYRLITLRQTHIFGENTLNETFSAELFPENRLENSLKEKSSWSNTIARGNNASVPMYRNLIFPRAAWFSGPKPQHPRLRQKIKYVVVDIGPALHCTSRDICVREMKSNYEKRVLNGLQGISYNFYIGGDGWVYEGRGWDSAPELNIEELEHDFLSVAFLRNNRAIPLSPLTMYGFDHLMLSGIKEGTIAIDYKIVSMYQLFPKQTAYFPDVTLPKDIKTWNRWTENVPYSAGTSDSPSGKDIFVSTQNWRPAGDWKRVFSTRQIRRILVLNVGSRCFVRENCTDVVRAEQEPSGQAEGFVTESFYIGEDGHVYEGHGWNSPPNRNLMAMSRDAITVAFLGDFERDVPDPKALFAFKYLMNLGTYLDQISDSYRIGPLRDNCSPDASLGKALEEKLRLWVRWGYTTPNDCSSHLS